MLLKVGVDSGKSQTRLAFEKGGNVQFIKFPITVVKNDFDASNEGYEVVYKNKRYLVGENIRNNNLESTKNSKLDDNHKICVLTGLAQMIIELGYTNNHVEVEMGINVPVSLFKSKELRSLAEEFYKGEVVEIEVNDRKVRFTTTSCKAYHESLGAYLNNRHRVGESVICFDFGSLNTNMLHYEDGRVIAHHCNSFEYGGTELLSKINSALVPYEVKMIQNHIYRIANGETLKGFDDNHVAIAKNVIKNHVKTLIVDAMNFNKEIPFKTADIVFSGGSTRVFKEFLEMDDVFPNKNYVFSKELEYDSCLAALRIL